MGEIHSEKICMLCQPGTGQDAGEETATAAELPNMPPTRSGPTPSTKQLAMRPFFIVTRQSVHAALVIHSRMERSGVEWERGESAKEERIVHTLWLTSNHRACADQRPLTQLLCLHRESGVASSANSRVLATWTRQTFNFLPI